MKTAGKETPNSRAGLHIKPSPWGGRSEPSTLIQSGWKERKNSAVGEVFFLTFPFIELHGRWAPPDESFHNGWPLGSRTREQPSAMSGHFRGNVGVETRNETHYGLVTLPYYFCRVLR